MSNTWNEADHPRDEEGKFTYKDGGASGSSNNNSMSREDILYPTMKDKYPKVNYDNIGLGNYNNEKLSREDILFPTMNNKKVDGVFTGGAAQIPYNDKSYNDIKNSVQTENDRNFFTALDVVFGSEGKYSNNKNDKGGPTNMGVTQSTYNDYCKRHNLPIKNVKNLSRTETIQVFYNDYWVKSGLDKENDPIKSVILFDTAVLYGVGRTKEFIKKSGGNLYKLLDLRREHHINEVKKDPTQKEFINGWFNRIDRLKKILDRYEEIKKNRNN